MREKQELLSAQVLSKRVSKKSDVLKDFIDSLKKKNQDILIERKFRTSFFKPSYNN
jgi:hypothetical protein